MKHLIALTVFLGLLMSEAGLASVRSAESFGPLMVAQAPDRTVYTCEAYSYSGIDEAAGKIAPGPTYSLSTTVTEGISFFIVDKNKLFNGTTMFQKGTRTQAGKLTDNMGMADKLLIVKRTETDKTYFMVYVFEDGIEDIKDGIATGVTGVVSLTKCTSRGEIHED